MQSLEDRVAIAKDQKDKANRLISEFKPFIAGVVQKKVGRFVEYGVDEELSVGLMAFKEAIDSYDRQKSKFLSFARMVISMRLIDYYRKSKKERAASLDQGDRSDIASDQTSMEQYRIADENIWGVSKDMEEIILGAVSGLEVAGIGSIIDEHIKNFNPVLEGAWMKGHPIKSMDDAQMIQVKRLPRQIQREIIVTEANISPSSQTNVSERQSSSDEASVQFSQMMSDTFKAKKKEVSEQIISKLNDIKLQLNESSKKGDLGSKLEELKEFIITSYGFSRLVFDVSKISRKLQQDAMNTLNDVDIKDLKDNIDLWKDKL